MATDALLIDPKPEESPDPFKGETPTLDEFSKYRETGELPERVLIAATKDQPRDDAGKFVEKVSWREDAAYRQAVIDGLIAPDEKMSADEWAAARRAQIERGTVNIAAAPKLEGEKVEAVKPSGDQQKHQAEAPFLPPTHPHLERAKQAEAFYPDLVEAVNAVPFTISTELGRAMVELPNSADVLYKLAKNPGLLAQMDKLSLNERVHELAKLSKSLGRPQSAKAFDVTDESLSADEWAKKRNEQLRKRQER
jgi:hypothetical protein